MLNFFKKLISFFSPGPERPLAALESPTDKRIIATVDFQDPVSLPATYETLMPGVEDQGQKSICVGEAFAKLIELYFQLQGIIVDISEDDLYGQCKNIDGIPDQLGTYPVIGAKVSASGVSDRASYMTGNAATIAASRALHKVSGYASVPLNFDAICQAIYQNKAIAASMAVDSNFFAGKMMKVLQSLGRHMIVLHGFDYNVRSNTGQNSWGIAWIGYIAGIINPAVKPGHFQVKWEDIADTIGDAFVLAKIPDDLIQKAKGYEYRFMTNITQGMQSYDVQKLQERLISEGFLEAGHNTGLYGSLTAAAVAAYQKANGISPVGSSVGPLTRAQLNKKAMSLIPLLAKAIQAHEGYYDATQSPPLGSRSFRNHNPGNFKLSSSTVSAYMLKLGATGTDAGNFVIFPDYATGFNALCTFLTDAALGHLTSYNASMPIYTGDPKNKGFLDVYAPGIENNTLAYAQSIAKQIGYPYTTPIKDLV